MAEIKPVVLVLAADKREGDGFQTDVVLTPGLAVAARLHGKTTSAVTYNGRKGDFVNALTALIAPTRVFIQERQVERDVEVDGHTVKATVPEYTASLADG